MNDTNGIAKMDDGKELEQALKRLPEAERLKLLYMVRGIELAIEVAASRVAS